MTNNIKKCYLDSNILISYKNRDLKSQKLIIRLLNSSYNLFISPLVLDEFLFQASIYLKKQKQRNVLKKLLESLESIFKLPRLIIINPSAEKKKHLQIIKYMEKYGLRPRDAYHLLIIKENKISHFATFDKDFKKVFKAKVIKKFK